jgi:hypothetical protein
METAVIPPPVAGYSFDTKSSIPACGAPPGIASPAFVPRWSTTRALAIG